MYLQTLYTVAILFSILFVLASLFLINWKIVIFKCKMLPIYWEKAVIQVTVQKEIEKEIKQLDQKVDQQIKEFEDKGMICFSFEKGKVKVWAMDKKTAVQDYERMKETQRKDAFKTLKTLRKEAALKNEIKLKKEAALKALKK